jgi:hypothetical protein
MAADGSGGSEGDRETEVPGVFTGAEARDRAGGNAMRPVPASPSPIRLPPVLPAQSSLQPVQLPVTARCRGTAPGGWHSNSPTCSTRPEGTHRRDAPYVLIAPPARFNEPTLDPQGTWPKLDGPASPHHPNGVRLTTRRCCSRRRDGGLAAAACVTARLPCLGSPRARSWSRLTAASRPRRWQPTARRQPPPALDQARRRERPLTMPSSPPEDHPSKKFHLTQGVGIVG